MPTRLPGAPGSAYASHPIGDIATRGTTVLRTPAKVDRRCRP